MSDSYYDKKYFEWQKRAGEFGGVANLFKFEEYISKNSDVLDFGCGGVFTKKYQYIWEEGRCGNKSDSKRNG